MGGLLFGFAKVISRRRMQITCRAGVKISKVLLRITTFRYPLAQRMATGIPLRHGSFTFTPPMKKLFTPLACLLLSPLAAQTIQYGNLSPSGIQATMYLKTDNSPLQLSSGMGQAWNLSAASIQQVGTLQFTAAAGTPYAATYPIANWVWHQDAGVLANVYQYLNISSAGIDLLASNVPTGTVAYTPSMRVMQFPMDYGGSFTSSFNSTNGPGTVTWTYSGYGTLTTTLGTTPSLALLTSDDGDTTLWNINPVYPVLIMQGGTVTLYQQSNTGVAEQEAPPLQAWPNPCSDELMLANAAPGSQWQIVDLQGRTLRAGVLAAGSGRMALDTRGLAIGNYLVVLRNGLARQQVRFAKQ